MIAAFGYVNRKLQSKFWLTHTINSSILELFYSNEDVKEKIKELENQVMDGTTSPFKAARKILTSFKS